MKLLKATGPSHEEMIKEAVLGLLANVGKFVLKNPFRTGFAAMDAFQTAGAAKSFNQAAMAGRNMMQDVAATVPPGSM